jgi:hypothetical protein
MLLGTTAPLLVRIESSDGQFTRAGETLPEPLVIAVLTRDGDAVPGVEV